jgi:hypothetical protein
MITVDHARTVGLGSNPGRWCSETLCGDIQKPYSGKFSLCDENILTIQSENDL